MNRYALVGCGASKRDTAAEARNLYTSTYFEKKRAFADRHCKRWWVLSAEHAAILPSTVIDPYETHIDDVDTTSWARRVRLALRSDDCRWVSEDAELLVLAGQKYIDPIRDTLSDLDDSDMLGVTVRYPFADTSGIGEQLSVLNDLIESPEREVVAATQDECTGEAENESGTKQTKLVTDGGVDQSTDETDGKVAQEFGCEDCGGEVECVDYVSGGGGSTEHFRCKDCGALGIRDVIYAPGQGERLRGLVRCA